jgi:hypothetical protein
MVAPLTTTQRIVCTAVRIDEPGVCPRNRLAFRPSELVPWADPYIAGLVRRLQSEVRFERAAVTVAGPHADLEPPSPSVEPDWDSWDQPRWSTEEMPAE